MDKQLIDYNWFSANRNVLYEKYGVSYLAIKNQKVIGVYKTYAEGVIKTKEKEALGSFIVEYCTNIDSDYMNQIYSMNY